MSITYTIHNGGGNMKGCLNPLRLVVLANRCTSSRCRQEKGIDYGWDRRLWCAVTAVDTIPGHRALSTHTHTPRYSNGCQQRWLEKTETITIRKRWTQAHLTLSLREDTHTSASQLLMFTLMCFYCFLTTHTTSLRTLRTKKKLKLPPKLFFLSISLGRKTFWS